MKQTLVWTARTVACATVLLAVSSASAADPYLVVIRVYDLTTADAASRAAALREAAQIMASAGVAVDWRDCSRGGAAHPCHTRRGARDLVVRIIPAGTPSDNATATLGFAPIDPSGRGTVIATVYYDVVQRVANRTALDARTLLGRAIAHEIGHLLLRTPGHGRSGLMRPLWTDDQLAQNRAGDWLFSEEERRQVRAAVQEPDADDGPAGDADAAEAAGR